MDRIPLVHRPTQPRRVVAMDFNSFFRSFSHCEQSMVGGLFCHLPLEILLLWDRGFFSYQLWKEVGSRGVKILARVKSGLILVEAAVTVGLDPDRLSFLGCFQILACRLPECNSSTPEAFQQWYRGLLWEMQTVNR